MRVLVSVLVILLPATIGFAAELEDNKKEETSSQLNLEDAEIQTLEDISPTSQDNQDTEVKRKKKSTTTFCVEIRPSGPYQKPFQVCEPSEPAKPAAAGPASAYSTSEPQVYYAAPNYPTQEQLKPQVSYQPAAAPAYKPASQPKPAPAYSAPMKTYSAPSAAPASKSFTTHPMPYSSYRSKNAEGGTAEHGHDHMHMMRMTHASEEVEADENGSSSEATSDQQTRSSSYGISNYDSSGYGSSNALFPVVPKEKPKGHGHNGLVITCQPNLAGYAHNVPSSFHHPPGVSYAYRSSTPKTYGRYGRYHYNNVQLQPYEDFQQASSQRPAMAMFKPSAAIHSQELKPFSHSSSSFAPVYKQQVYGGQSSTYPSQVFKPSPPSYAPPPPPSSSYGPPPPASYAPSPSSYTPPAPPHSSYAPSMPPPAPSTDYAPSPLGYGSPLSPMSAAHASAASGFSSGQATMPSSSFASPPPSYSSYSQAPAQSTSAHTAYGSSSTGYAPSTAPAGFDPAPENYAPASAMFPPTQTDFASAQAAFAPASTQFSSPIEFAPGSSAAYAPTPPVPPPAPPSVPQAPSYIPPGTYRESEVETGTHSNSVTSHQLEKEKQTVKKMQELSQQRATGSQWNTEMSTDSAPKKNADEHVEASHQAWTSRTAETSRETGDVKRTEMDQDTKNNEIDHSV